MINLFTDPKRSYLLVLLALLHSPALLGAEKGAHPPHWIAVVAPEFVETIKPLAEHRRREGMAVTVLESSAVLTPQQIKAGDAGPLRARMAELCRDAKGECHVLLVGVPLAAETDDSARTVVPALKGTVGRMRGEPSDHVFGCLGKDLTPQVAVGRLPARSRAELASMIDKMLRFERDTSPERWRNDLTVLVGDPGGNTAAEKGLANLVVGGMMAAQLGKLDPVWSPRLVVHVPGSEFCVPDDRLRDTSLDYLKQGQIFSVYLGHSNATGFGSGNAPFLLRNHWEELKIPRGNGVLVSCGCFGCQVRGADGEGYGQAAIRNPNGPVAVLGAHGESYAIAGKLTAEALLSCLNRPQPPERLGEYWLAMQRGLASDPIDALTFWMFDQADGSRGRATLEEQRLEHLEMWMLLGDPAMTLPVRRATLQLKVASPAGPTEEAAPGGGIVISGKLPAALAGSRVQLTVARPLGSFTPGLKSLPADAAQVREVMLANHKLANEVVLLDLQVAPEKDGQFAGVLQLPEKLPWPHLIIRASAATEKDSALGVLRLKVAKPAVSLLRS